MNAGVDNWKPELLRMWSLMTLLMAGMAQGMLVADAPNLLPLVFIVMLFTAIFSFVGSLAIFEDTAIDLHDRTRLLGWTP